MRWVGHVARMGKRRDAYGVLVENLRKRGLLGHAVLNVRTISEWISTLRDWSGWGKGQVAGFCEHSNEASSSIKCGNFLSNWGPISFSRRALLDGASYEMHLREFTNRRTTETSAKSSGFSVWWRKRFEGTNFTRWWWCFTKSLQAYRL